MRLNNLQSLYENIDLGHSEEYKNNAETIGLKILRSALKGTSSIKSLKSTPSHMKEISITCSLVIN